MNGDALAHWGPATPGTNKHSTEEARETNMCQPRNEITIMNGDEGVPKTPCDGQTPIWRHCLHTAASGAVWGSKIHRMTCHEDPGGEKRYSSTLSLTSELDTGGWSTPRPCHNSSAKDTRHQGWTGMVGKISPNPTGIRSPKRPARSESLYRLSHPGPRRCIEQIR